MKNKLFKYSVIIFLSLIFFQKANSLDDFNFNVTTIEVLENGNVIKGLDKGIIKTNDGILLKQII